MSYTFEQHNQFAENRSGSIQLEEGDVRAVIQICNRKRDLNESLHGIFRDWSELIEPMDWHTPQFDNILQDFTRHMFSFLSKGDAVKRGAEYLVGGTLRNTQDYSFEDLIAFKKGYDDLKSELYTSLASSGHGKGEDGFGDLIDSLPLVGVTFCRDIVLEGNITSRRLEDIKNHIYYENEEGEWNNWNYFEDSQVWLDWVWNGENYISFSLTEALESTMGSYMRQIAPDNIEDEEVEVEVV